MGIGVEENEKGVGDVRMMPFWRVGSSIPRCFGCDDSEDTLEVGCEDCPNGRVSLKLNEEDVVDSGGVVRDTELGRRNSPNDGPESTELFDCDCDGV